MRITLALIFYSACFIILWAVHQTSEFEALNHGFPSTDSEVTVAIMLGLAMISKLFGHVMLFSILNQRN